MTRTTEVYELKITLLGSKPPIWRRIEVRSNTKLPLLSEIIQAVMGWDGAHLHQFIGPDRQYYMPLEPDIGLDMESEEESKFMLANLVDEVGDRLRYEYDFGDGWEHELKVVKIRPRQEGEPLPMCLAGKRACPPEDCGGVWGYAHMLEVLKDPDHEEHEDLVDWIDEDFDPEAFNLNKVNAELAGNWVLAP